MKKTNMNESFQNGFIKRAQEYGLNPKEAGNLLDSLKNFFYTGSDIAQGVQAENLLQKINEQPAPGYFGAGGALLGAGLGGGLGHLTGDKKKGTQGRNAAIGALLGGTLGAAGGANFGTGNALYRGMHNVQMESIGSPALRDAIKNDPYGVLTW